MYASVSFTKGEYTFTMNIPTRGVSVAIQPKARRVVLHFTAARKLS